MTKREYDHYVRGHVKISKKDGEKYKIKFHSISDFLVYQVSSIEKTLNANRYVLNQKAIDWVNIHFNYNKNISFTPTTVMELGNDTYVFVITNAYLNKKNEVVFLISTKSIDTVNNQLTNLPTGKFHNVRFDIDASGGSVLSAYQYNGVVPGPNGPTTQPTGPQAPSGSTDPPIQPGATGPQILIQPIFTNPTTYQLLIQSIITINPDSSSTTSVQPIYSYSTVNGYTVDPQSNYNNITSIYIIPEVGNAIVFDVIFNSIDTTNSVDATHSVDPTYNCVIYDIQGLPSPLINPSASALLAYNIMFSQAPKFPTIYTYQIPLINYLNN